MKHLKHYPIYPIMKPLNIAFFLLLSASMNAQNGSISGRIRNQNGTTDTAFKMVFIYKHIRVDSSFSRAAGFYQKSLPEGVYDIEFSKTACLPVFARGIVIRKDEQMLNFSLRFSPIPVKAELNAKEKSPEIPESVFYDDVSVVYIRKPGYGALSSKTKRIVTPPFLHRSSDADYAEPARLEPESDKMAKPASEHAGQITAGHWRDLDHWEDWQKTNQDSRVAAYQTQWGIMPGPLLGLQLKDLENNPLAYVNIVLKNKSGLALWHSCTDEAGRAWFWPTAFAQKETSDLQIEVMQKTYADVQPYFNSQKAYKIDVMATESHIAEIGFVVDATGSMGDEIRYLQAELMDVISRVRRKNKCMEIRTGSVFYRDHGDQYVTRVEPLSSNPANTIEFIGNQSAGGGGDFPEALDLAMEAAIGQLNWSAGNHARILFLLLDAPPHETEENKARIRRCIEQAAEKGIRIVPIAASGINQSTEFLLKYMAILSNGEYLYITDDSKIGNAHLKPTGGESKVDYLNDLMVKLINRYCSAASCPDQNTLNPDLPSDSSLVRDSSQQQIKDREIVVSANWHMQFYPNPSASLVNIAFSERVESLKITDLSGRVLYEMRKPESALTVDVQQWSTGLYLIAATLGNETITGKLLVMH